MYSSKEELEREEMRRLDEAIRQEGRKPQPLMMTPPHEHYYQYIVSETIVIRGCACGDAAFIWKLNEREGWSEIWTKIEEER